MNFSELWVWLSRVARYWHGWLPSSAIAAGIGLAQGLNRLQPKVWMYFVVLVLGVGYSMFRAWQEEYVANRNGPQISVEWNSRGNSRSKDFVKLRNIGSTTAFCVSFGEFSIRTVRWHDVLDIQALHPNEEVIREVKFAVGEIGKAEIGYMCFVVAKQDVSIPISYSDVNRTEFTRWVHLTQSGNRDFPVLVTLGELTAKRPKH
jgi:hypothetical protein